MKKLISIILALLLISGSTVNAFALGLLLPIKGDADADGRITASDARLILRAAVGLHTPMFFRKNLYDIDSNGEITAFDARIALRVAVGLEEMPSSGENNNEISVTDISKLISADELSRLMNNICSIGSRSVIYPKNNLAAQNLITEELKSYGLGVGKQSFIYAGIETANIVSILNKNENYKEILLLATHYDCWDGVGAAIDNASGVAALLHIAKIIKEYDIHFNKEIRFAFFSAEEMGYHGAYHYLSRLSEDEKSRITVFNIDMAGHSALGGGKYLTVSTEPVSGSYTWRQAQPNEISDAIEKAKNELGNLGEERFYSPVAAGRHDIVPFREQGIPSVTLSWREIRSAAAYGSDYDLAPPSQIHTYLDTLNNFDMSSLENTTKLILLSLLLGFGET